MTQITNNPDSKPRMLAIACIVHAISPVLLFWLASPPRSLPGGAIVAAIAFWTWPVWILILRRRREQGAWAFRNPIIIGMLALVPALPYALLYAAMLIGALLS